MLVVVKWRLLGTLPVAASTESHGGRVAVSTVNDAAGEPGELSATSDRGRRVGALNIGERSRRRGRDQWSGAEHPQGDRYQAIGRRLILQMNRHGVAAARRIVAARGDRRHRERNTGGSGETAGDGSHREPGRIRRSIHRKRSAPRRRRRDRHRFGRPGRVADRRPGVSHASQCHRGRRQCGRGRGNAHGDRDRHIRSTAGIEPDHSGPTRRTAATGSHADRVSQPLRLVCSVQHL